MAYALPVWELSNQKREIFRKTVQEMLICRALDFRIIADRWEGEITALTSKDVGLEDWKTPPQRKNEPDVWIHAQVAPNKVVGIYKVIQLSMRPKVTTIQFQLGSTGATTLGVFGIEEIYALLPVLRKVRQYEAPHGLHRIFGSVEDMVMEAYLTEAVVYNPDQWINIQVVSREENKTGDRLMLGGFVLEPQGRLIC